MKRFTPEQERLLSEWVRTQPDLRKAFPYTIASNVGTKGLGFLLNKEQDSGRFYISVQQSDGKQRLDVTELLTFNKDSFYLTKTSDPFEIMVNFRGTAGGSSGGVTDHGALTGLLDDDHPQYARKAASQITFDGTVTAEAFYVTKVGELKVLDFNTSGFYVTKGSKGQSVVNLVNDTTSKHFTLQSPTKKDTITWFVADRNYTVRDMISFLRTADSGFYPFCNFTIRHRAGIPSRGKGTELTTNGWRIGFYPGGNPTATENPLNRGSFTSPGINNGDFVWIETTNLGEGDGKEQELHVTIRLV